MSYVDCPTCGSEVELKKGKIEIECAGCGAMIPTPRRTAGERGSKRRREFDASREINRMWCPECQCEVTASRENSERFNNVFGFTFLIAFALGCGVAWTQIVRNVDWELIAFLFLLYLGVASYLCAVVANAAAQGSVFRCKTCETETEVL